MSQTIRRAARRNRFLIIDQAAVEDVRLSWAARGLLAYLLSRPDDWKVLINDLRRRGNLGRDGVYGLLRELRSAGYVRFERKRDVQGRIRGGTYIVSELPAPHPALPDVAKPDTGPPYPVKPGALPKTNENKETTTTTRPTTTYTAVHPCDGAPPLNIEGGVPPELRIAAARIVAAMDPEAAQLVVGEWAGALAAGVIRRSPMGYLKALVERYQAGDMGIRYAVARD